MVAAGRTRPFAVAAVTAAIAGMGMLAGCGSAKDTPAPSTSPSAPASIVPTEKNLTPGGNNSFDPTVKGRPSPTALPGNAVSEG